MKNKQPPFQITNKIIDDVAEISELAGRLSAHDHLSSNPNLRRTNRIRTIHGSLAIEQNTLSLEQVTAVLNGKHIPVSYTHLRATPANRSSTVWSAVLVSVGWSSCMSLWLLAMLRLP